MNDQSTITNHEMRDILRIDLISEINTFSIHVQDKIERLDERMRFVNYKFEDVRFWFRRYSISIIYLATILTLIEALMNSLDIESLSDKTLKSFIKFLPLLLSSLVSLIAAIIKFNKYEEKIEDITRATEKCIMTIAKLKEVKEELYFCKTVDNFLKINDRFTRDIYTEYLESNTNIERQLLDTDYAKYMKKVAHNDVQRARILINRNKALDNLGDQNDKRLYSNLATSPLAEDVDDVESNNINKDTRREPMSKLLIAHRPFSIAAEHNGDKRRIPYRGGSPLLSKTNIINKKLTRQICFNCKKTYLSDITYRNNINEQNRRCSNCYNINDNIDLGAGLSPKRDVECYVNCIQKRWRGYRVRRDNKK